MKFLVFFPLSTNYILTFVEDFKSISTPSKEISSLEVAKNLSFLTLLSPKLGSGPLRSGPAFPQRPPCARFVAGGPTDAGPTKISQVDFGEKNNFLSTTSRWLSTAAISPSTRAGPRGTVPNAESRAGPASKPGWPGTETSSRPPRPWLESVDWQFKKFYDGAFPFGEFLTHSAN